MFRMYSKNLHKPAITKSSQLILSSSTCTPSTIITPHSTNRPQTACDAHIHTYTCGWLSSISLPAKCHLAAFKLRTPHHTNTVDRMHNVLLDNSAMRFRCTSAKAAVPAVPVTRHEGGQLCRECCRCIAECARRRDAECTRCGSNKCARLPQ